MTEPRGAFMDLYESWVRERLQQVASANAAYAPRVRRALREMEMARRNRELTAENERLREELRRLRDAMEDDHR